MNYTKKLISLFVVMMMLCTISFAESEMNSMTRTIPMPQEGNSFEWMQSTDDNPLGGASNFNGFVLGDFNSGIDVEGSLAVGGSLNTGNFSVNLRGEATDDVSLLVGGNITATQGAVNGTTVAGTSEGNNYNLSNVTVSNVTTQGQYNVVDSSQYFQNAKEDLTARSESIASQAATGQVNDNGYGHYNLSGGDEDVVVFELNTNEIKNFNFNVDLKDGQKAIINVTGTEMTFDSGSMSINGNKDDKYLRENADRILFNASDATTINVSNAALYGDFLAPNASLNGSSANIAGTTVVNNYTGTQGFELHLSTTPTPSDPTPTPVPSEDPTPTPVPSENPTPTPVSPEDSTPTPVPPEDPTPTPVPPEDSTPTPVPPEDPTPTPVPPEDPTPTPLPQLPATDGPHDGFLQYVGIFMIGMAIFAMIIVTKYKMKIRQN